MTDVVTDKAPMQNPVNNMATTQPETPAVEPVVEPVVEPGEAAPVAPVEKLELDAPVVKADKTGNKTFDDVAALLADKGVANGNAIFKAVAETGEVSLTDSAAIVAALGDTVGNMVINSMVQEAAKIKTAETGRADVTLQYAAQKFGEPEKATEVWAAIQAFAKTPESGFSADDRKAMTKMLRAGGLQAEMVIDRLHAKYEASSGFTQEADLVQGQTLPAGTAAISAKDYADQMRVVAQQHGYDSHQAETLKQQRLASIQRGY